jgi:hypothetical protein
MTANDSRPASTSHTVAASEITGTSAANPSRGDYQRRPAIGLQIAEAGERPAVIREPTAFRALHVEGLGTFVQHQATAWLAPYRSACPQVWESFVGSC